MIPAFRPGGVLPEGVHEAQWAEVEAVFGWTPERRELLKRLRRGLDNLRDAGVRWVLLDGSFVTSKDVPRDVDGCWEWDPGVVLVRLDPAFLLASRADRLMLFERYGMDFFVSSWVEAGSGQPFAEFFQIGRDGHRRGIVRIDLAAEVDQGQ